MKTPKSMTDYLKLTDAQKMELAAIPPVRPRSDALLGVRPISPQDVIREANANYDMGRKHGRDEKADLLDWAESLLCNAVPTHCTQADWDDAVRRWRDEKHGVSTPNKSSSFGAAAP